MLNFPRSLRQIIFYSQIRSVDQHAKYILSLGLDDYDEFPKVVGRKLQDIMVDTKVVPSVPEIEMSQNGIEVTGTVVRIRTTFFCCIT